jgi:hypothetical protein
MEGATEGIPLIGVLADEKLEPIDHLLHHLGHRHLAAAVRAGRRLDRGVDVDVIAP